MTAPGQQKEKTAAVWFAGLLTLALGGAGLIIAALAVGAERAWAGGATEQQRARERRGGWLDGQRSWLDADHTQRTAWARQRKTWLDTGSDPATEPSRPSLWKRLRDGVRRRVANTAIAGADFAEGARDGWRAANDSRRDGGNFRDIATARPGRVVCANCRRARVPVTAGGLCGDCTAALEVSGKAAPEGATPGTEQQCRNCRQPGPVGYDGACAHCKQATAGSAPERHLSTTNERTPPISQTQTPPARSAPAHRRAPDPWAAAPGCPACGGQTTFMEWMGSEDTPTYWCDPCRLEFVPEKGFYAQCPPCGLYEQYDTREEAKFASDRHQARRHATTPNGNTAAEPAPAGRAATPPTEGEPMGSTGHEVPAPPREPTYHEEFARALKDTLEGKPDPHRQGGAMTAPAQTTESNATVLRGKLQSTKTILTRIAELTDELAAERTKLDGQVKDSDEFATATGQSSQARQALDESKALSAAMGDRLGEFSQGAVSAEDQMAHAADGLRPAENAEDELRSAGADHRAVAPAGANA